MKYMMIKFIIMNRIFEVLYVLFIDIFILFKMMNINVIYIKVIMYYVWICNCISYLKIN